MKLIIVKQQNKSFYPKKKFSNVKYPQVIRLKFETCFQFSYQGSPWSQDMHLLQQKKKQMLNFCEIFYFLLETPFEQQPLTFINSNLYSEVPFAIHNASAFHRGFKTYLVLLNCISMKQKVSITTLFYIT